MLKIDSLDLHLWSNRERVYHTRSQYCSTTIEDGRHFTISEFVNIKLPDRAKPMTTLLKPSSLISKGLRVEQINNLTGSSLPGMLIVACYPQTIAVKLKTAKKSNNNRF